MTSSEIQFEIRYTLFIIMAYENITSARPALGIGRECDGLGPMLVGGPKFFFY